MAARRLREQQVEADRVVEALSAALAVDGDELLSEEEKAAILAARDALIERRRDADHEAIKAAIEQVEKASEAYVARRMNRNIRKVMAGHKVDEFQQ